MNELDVAAAETKATYEEIREYVKEHTGLIVKDLYIAQVKQKCGTKERANYNKPKSENSRQPKCPPENQAGIYFYPDIVFPVRLWYNVFRSLWYRISEKRRRNS